MISIFLQNLAVVLTSLLILANHRADYTLYITIAAIALASIRLIFATGSGSAKVTLFLIQSFIFAIVMWYILYPRLFVDLLNAF